MFANNKTSMAKEYAHQEEQLARFAKATDSQHLSELKDAGLIQGEIQPPKVKYCINQENWVLAKRLMEEFMCSCNPGNGCCK